MGLGSGKISEGSRSLFGSISIPNLKSSEFAGVLRSGVGQITDLARKYTRSGDTSSFAESVKSRHESTRDLDAYGFEKFQSGDDIEVFVRDTPVEKVFMDSEIKFEPVVSAATEKETVAPIEQPKAIEDYSMDAEEVPATEEIEVPAPVVEQPKIEEFMDQPVIIRPDIVEEAPETEEVDMYVGEAPVVATDFEPSSLFGNIRRGMSEEVDTHVGCVEDGFIKESASNVTLYDFDAPVTAEDIHAEDAAIDEMEELSSQMEPAPTEERLMLRPYVQKIEPEEPAVYVERAVPKLEDFFVDLPEKTEPAPVVAVVPEWDVAEADAAVYSDFLSLIPEETTWDVAPVWEVSDAAVEAFAAYQTIRPEYPKAAVIVPEWDIKADTFADYLSFIPEETTWDVAPVWDVTEDAADAFVAFGTIRPEYPKAAVVIPEWDIKADTFADYLSFIPEETTWEVAPVWDVSEDASEAFIAFGTIRPEYPKAVAIIPEWDVTEAAVEGFEAYRMAEEDYFRQSAMFVAATVSNNRIEIDAIERNISDAVAAVSGMTGTFAETTGASKLLIPVKNNMDINQENLQIVPEVPAEKKIRASRFVFRDGKLQKITEEVDLKVDVPVSPGSSTVSEKQPETEAARLSASKGLEAIPASVTQITEGVKFSFGESKKGYGSVRFSF